MPLHACSTQREREGGGEKRRREGEEARSEGGGAPGSPSLRVTLPPFLPFSFSSLRSLSQIHTQTCMCVSFHFLLWLISHPPSSSSSSFLSSSPPPPPTLAFTLQGFLLTSSDSAWKEVKEKIKKRKQTEKEDMNYYFFPLLYSFLLPTAVSQHLTKQTSYCKDERFFLYTPSLTDIHPVPLSVVKRRLWSTRWAVAAFLLQQKEKEKSFHLPSPPIPHITCLALYVLGANAVIPFLYIWMLSSFVSAWGIYSLCET